MTPGILPTEATTSRPRALAALLGVPPSRLAERSATPYEREDSFSVPRVVISFPKGVPTEVVVDA